MFIPTKIASLVFPLLALPAAPQELVGFDAEDFGRVVLSDRQSAIAGDVEFELSIGDYKNEFISTYSPSSIFAQVGRSVGRLDVLTDKGVFPCTAFLVDGNLLVTNHHCVPGIRDNAKVGAESIIAVRFVAGYVQEGVEEGTRTFHVDPAPLETSRELDYTVLKVLGDPVAEFGRLRLAAAVPEDGSPYWVIGHPLGEAQRISREQCKANRPALSGGRLLHTCDTLPGNSGSPVVDATLRMVVGLHHAGSKRSSVNYAIPMARILAQSEVLKASATAAPTAEADPAAQALSAALLLDDPAARRAALAGVVDGFPGSESAAHARALLERVAAEARVAEADAALLEAMLGADDDARASALRQLIATYPDSGAADRARDVLARLQAEAPSEGPYPTGTILKAAKPGGTIIMHQSPGSEKTWRVWGTVTLGEHVGDGWYVVPDRHSRFVQVSGLVVDEVALDEAMERFPIEDYFDRLPPGTVVTPTNGAEFRLWDGVGSSTSIFWGKPLTLAENLGNGWYRTLPAEPSEFFETYTYLQVQANSKHGFDMP